jgi:hypothetical protein
MHAVTIGSASLLGVGIVTMVAYRWSLSEAIYEGKCEISRFPMFAARDALIELVADGCSRAIPRGRTRSRPSTTF